MPSEARARILVVGSELLGDRADAHGPVLARFLRDRGLIVEGLLVAPDDRAVLAEAIRHALVRPGLLVITGGLGPTDDDVTREALEDATGRACAEDAGGRRRIEEFLASRGRQASPMALRQCLLPEGAEAVPNPTGLAVGAVLGLPDSVVVLLPGPPGELAAMLDGALDRAERLLRERGLLPSPRPALAELLLAGIGESDAAACVAGRAEIEAVAVAWLPRPGEVRMRLCHPDAATLAPAVAAARAALGGNVVSADGRGLAEVILATLIEREESIATAESCTGGLIAAEITSVPGSSAAFRRGFVTYACDAKTEVLGVPPDVLATCGAVSAEVAEAMALGARRAGRSDWGVGVTGIAGPGGGSAEKPVGLVHWAVARPDGRVESWHAVFGGSRDDVRRRATSAALDAVRRCL